MVRPTTKELFQALKKIKINKKGGKKISSEDALKQTTRIWGCLSFSLTLQNFWKAHLSIRRRVLAAAQGAWWVSPSPGAATPH